MKPLPRILLFTGEGKGKTTAALGMALRAAGHKLPTLIIQFIKHDSSTGELAALHSLAGVEIRQVGQGFVPKPSSPKFAEHQQSARQALATAEEALSSGQYRLVILDEICVAVAKKLLSEEAVLAAVQGAPSNTIVVLTGREASPGLISLADTVTEMRCVKHGLSQGWKAQPGVEF